MLDQYGRKFSEKLTAPIGTVLNKLGISADMLTIVGLLVAIATGVAVATGHHLIAGIGVLVAGIPDLHDGSIARASGKVNSRGQFLDSLCDRLSDAALFTGAVWFYGHAQNQAFLAALSALALTVSLLISYARALAAAIGFQIKGGIMERAERLIVFGVSLTFGYLYIGIWIIAILGSVTLVQRHIKVWKLATEANGLASKLADLQALFDSSVENISNKRAKSKRKRKKTRSKKDDESEVE